MSKEESPKTFFEIVNWKKAQENIQGKNNFWCKLYTSILDNERVINLDDTSFRLLVNLWVLAARLGTHIFPADTKWLMRRMAFLTSEPDLKPLFKAKDMYGRNDPLIRYCDPPDQQQKNDTASEGTKKTYSQNRGQKKVQHKDKVSETANDQLYEKAIEIAGKTGFVSTNNLQKKLNIGNPKAVSIINSMREKGLLGKYVNCKGHEYIASSEKSKTEENRIDKSIEEETREDTEILTDFGREETEKKKTDLKGKEQNRKKQSPENMQAEAQRQKEKLLQAESDDSGRKPVNPLNPMDSDETAVSTHYVPKQPSSAFRDGKIIHIGNVLAERFPEHWSDADAESFGWEIVEALGYSTDRENVKSRSEWGSFASWWKRVKQTASSIAYQELRTIAIDKAKYVRTKAKSAKNKSAVWFTIMNKELSTRGIILPDSRASPA